MKINLEAYSVHTNAINQGNKLNSLRVYFFTVLALFFAVAPIDDIQAASDSSSVCRSLDTIKASGKIRIGVYNDDPYFSYIDPTTQRLEGFDADLARAITEEIMGDPNKAEYIIIDSEKRLDLLKNGMADLVIAELSMTNQRRNIVDFSDVYYIAGQSILVNVDSPFHSLDDLRGQTVGAVIGTTNANNVQEILPNSKLKMFPSLTSGFQALRGRQIQAFCIDDVMLIALKAHPDRILLDYRFIGGEISWESYGIAVSKGCNTLLKAINDALHKIKSDGRWQHIYDENIGHVSRVSAGPPT